MISLKDKINEGFFQNIGSDFENYVKEIFDKAVKTQEFLSHCFQDNRLENYHEEEGTTTSDFCDIENRYSKFLKDLPDGTYIEDQSAGRLPIRYVKMSQNDIKKFYSSYYNLPKAAGWRWVRYVKYRDGWNEKNADPSSTLQVLLRYTTAKTLKCGKIDDVKEGFFDNIGVNQDINQALQKEYDEVVAQLKKDAVGHDGNSLFFPRASDNAAKLLKKLPVGICIGWANGLNMFQACAYKKKNDVWAKYRIANNMFYKEGHDVYSHDIAQQILNDVHVSDRNSKFWIVTDFDKNKTTRF